MTQPIRKLLLIGDSDIEFWPSYLLPTVQPKVPVLVHGYSGATVADIIPKLTLALDSEQESEAAGRNQSGHLLLVACAGENDLGKGIPVDATEISFRSFLDTAFSKNPATSLIFLGPKFEPWMDDDSDPDSSLHKKSYAKLSRALQRVCQEHEHTNQILFVDCLTMFCDNESAKMPGAVLGGKAMADPDAFSSDRLHLSDAGYQTWKEILEHLVPKVVDKIVASSS